MQKSCSKISKYSLKNYHFGFDIKIICALFIRAQHDVLEYLTNSQRTRKKVTVQMTITNKGKKSLVS